MAPATVSEATPDDLDALLESVAGLFREDAGQHDTLVNVDWPAGHGAAYYSGLMTDRDCLIALARDGDRVIGHLVGRLNRPSPIRTGSLAVLESMRVVPDARRAGAGACSSGTSSAGRGNAARSRPALPPSPPTTRRGASTHGTASSPPASACGPLFSAPREGKAR